MPSSTCRWTPWLTPAWSEWADPECCALATIGNRLYLAYCYGETSHGMLKGLAPAAEYAASWVDPRTGEETIIARRFPPGPDGTWPVPARPAGDWLLRLARTSTAGQGQQP